MKELISRVGHLMSRNSQSCNSDFDNLDGPGAFILICILLTNIPTIYVTTLSEKELDTEPKDNFRWLTLGT